MQLMQGINQLSRTKMPWALLALSSGGLLLAALYFQHVMDLQPCIKCIYQRTAVIGILIAALIPLIYNHLATRILAMFVWAYSAYEGLLSAREHIEVIFADDMFFAVCGFVPDFPSFLPLHEWIPSIFAATGSCEENSWQFMSMGMAQWLQIIFSAYLLVLAIVVVAQFFTGKNKS